MAWGEGVQAAPAGRIRPIKLYEGQAPHPHPLSLARERGDRQTGEEKSTAWGEGVQAAPAGKVRVIKLYEG